MSDCGLFYLTHFQDKENFMEPDYYLFNRISNFLHLITSSWVSGVSKSIWGEGDFINHISKGQKVFFECYLNENYLSKFSVTPCLINYSNNFFSSTFVETTLETRTGSLSKVFFPSVVVCNMNEIRKSFMYNVLEVSIAWTSNLAGSIYILDIYILEINFSGVQRFSRWR